MGTAKIDAPKDRYEVWVGDDLITFTDETKFKELYSYKAEFSYKSLKEVL